MNFPFINNFICKIKKETILETFDWMDFDFTDLFPNCEHGARLKKSDRKIGDVPLITAGQFNNGISEYITPPERNRIYSNCVTIDMFGNCFYHDYSFVCDDNVYPVIGNYGKNVGLFLCTVIHNTICSNFSFKKQFRYKQMKTIKIKLPVDENAKPNWIYMSDYIKKIEEDILEKLK